MTPDFSETLKAVNEFYSNAWGMLMGALGAILIVGAGAVPLFSLWLQRRALQMQEQTLISVIKAEVEKEKAILLDVVKKQMEETEKGFEKRFKLLEETTKERAAGVECGIYLVQGNINLKAKDLPQAFTDYANGLYGAFIAKNENLIRIFLDNISKALNVSDASVIEDILQEKHKPDKIIEYLKTKNDDRRYSLIIQQLTKKNKDVSCKSSTKSKLEKQE